VEFIGTRLRDDVDLPARIVPIFRIEVVGHDTKLGDRVEIGNHSCPGKGKFLNGRSIQQETVRRLTLAVHRQVAGVQVAGNIVEGEARGAELPTLPAGQARGNWSYSRLQSQQVRIAARHKRHGRDGLRADDFAILRAGRIE